MRPSGMYATIFIEVLSACARARWLKGYGIIAMQRTEGLDDHERFEELCALVQTNSLDIRERLELERHLESCGTCRELCAEYSMIGEDGMPFLSSDYALSEEAKRWDSSAARERLFSSIRSQRTHKVLSITTGSQSSNWKFAPLIKGRYLAIGSLAACLLVAVGLGAFLIGQRKSVVTQATTAPMVKNQPGTVPPNHVNEDLLQLRNAQIAKLEQQILRQDQELARFKSAASLSDARLRDVENLRRETEANLRQLGEERDKLVSSLGEINGAYQKLQTDFTSLKEEYNHTLLRTAPLESEVSSMTALNHEQERKMKNDEQYLVSDRDIRELMGARKLYIADVFDVDSASHTRKPFGRVFYTQNKSLVFYAFDLDHQPGIKNASDFQVWGQRDSESNGASHPMNLGILSLDSEQNRRWVLRSDDPRQLAEIDAVFVRS